LEHILHGFAVLVGLILLYFGGDKFVDGAARLAVSFRLSQIVVGLVIVAFATSAPELVVGIDAALTDHSELAIGNVVGSNIANLFLILGICAIIRPIPVNINVLKFDKPIMIGASLLMLLFLFDKRIARWEGAVFAAGLVTYVSLNLRFGRRQMEAEGMKKPNKQKRASQSDTKHTLFALLLLIGGLIGLVAGARLLVFGASNIARWWGVSESLIGLSIVAFGTSLPELATGTVASVRKQSDLVVGNMIGSNIFNILGVLGIAALIRPLGGADIAVMDPVVMVITALLMLPVMLTKRRISRAEGVIMLLCYCGYIVYRYMCA